MDRLDRALDGAILKSEAYTFFTTEYWPAVQERV